LVTARHSVRRALELGEPYARFNRKSGSTAMVQLPNKWVYADSDAVDVAVLPIELDSDIVLGGIRRMLLATDDEIRKYNIGIGDDLVIVGLFSQRHGSKRNIPIVRTGIIAAMPEEPLEDPDTGDPYNAYLAEVRSIGGISGSPVYAVIPTFLPSKPRAMSETFYLIGLIRSHWDLTKRTSLFDFGNDSDAKLNMGIAAVTPIQEVAKVLEDPILIELRANDRKRHRQAQAPTLDSSFPEAQGPSFTQGDSEDALRKVSQKIESKK
jgi:hypothetical protein